MQPIDFLQEELTSIDRVLRETLRHEYGPDRSQYFTECRLRLQQISAEVERAESPGARDISAWMRRLAAIGSRISLIERAHVGESSWPFAETMRGITDTLLQERTLKREAHAPILHVIAEGVGYQIVNEQEPQGTRKIVVVAFPRQLKHHVLLHTIFGHELGHTALQTANPLGSLLTDRVSGQLRSKGPLSGLAELRVWVEAGGQEVRRYGGDLEQDSLDRWVHEIICDLFGLLLFGPAFAAAHRALLEPHNAGPAEIRMGSTHPPYSVRRALIHMAIEILGWHKPSFGPDASPGLAAEKTFLEYARGEQGSEWHRIVGRGELEVALDTMKSAMAGSQATLFQPLSAEVLAELVGRLSNARPPIIDSLDEDGRATNTILPTSHILYAGWVYWLGKEQLFNREGTLAKGKEPLTFLETNQLCNQALLQQFAMKLVEDSVGRPRS